MRGDIVYRVYGLHEGREKDNFFGAFRSRSEADEEIAKLYAMEMDGRNWAKQYHNKGFVVRETVVTVNFEIPSQPKPRDKYVVNRRHTPDRIQAAEELCAAENVAGRRSSLRPIVVRAGVTTGWRQMHLRLRGDQHRGQRKLRG
jgi:hypothetical protein